MSLSRASTRSPKRGTRGADSLAMEAVRSLGALIEIEALTIFQDSNDLSLGFLVGLHVPAARRRAVAATVTFVQQDVIIGLRRRRIR
jgi:hypothetical protein